MANYFNTDNREEKPIMAREALVPGAYILDIKEAEEIPGYGGSRVLVITYDIDEEMPGAGGFYQRKYEADAERNPGEAKWKGKARFTIPIGDGSKADSYRKRTLAGLVEALEKSNDGFKYNGDPATMAGKKIGAAFAKYHSIIDGKEISWVAFRWPAVADRVRAGIIATPADVYRDGAEPPKAEETPKMDADGFMPTEDEDLPFI